jgi:hypothetical protein
VSQPAVAGGIQMNRCAFEIWTEPEPGTAFQLVVAVTLIAQAGELVLTLCRGAPYKRATSAARRLYWGGTPRFFCL